MKGYFYNTNNGKSVNISAVFKFCMAVFLGVFSCGFAYKTLMIGALRVLESKMHLSGFRFCSVEFLKSEIESSLNYSSEEKAQCVCACVCVLSNEHLSVQT